jgi:hypothetical protein
MQVTGIPLGRGEAISGFPALLKNMTGFGKKLYFRFSYSNLPCFHYNFEIKIQIL